MTEILLSLFLVCFFNFIQAQIHISQGVTVFVDKSTFVTENLANAISSTGSISPEHSEGTSANQQVKKTSVTKTVRKNHTKKNILELTQDRKQQAVKKQKPKPVSFIILNNSSDKNFTTPSNSGKQVIFPDHQLKWIIPQTFDTFYRNYFVEKNKSFYLYKHSLILTSTSFRTRPPPFHYF